MKSTQNWTFLLFIVPFWTWGQWTHPYITGQGYGYGSNSVHGTFDGYFTGDSLKTFGLQQIGSSSSPEYEYFQDSYDLISGTFGLSKIIYQWDGSPTNDRKLQSFNRYSNGYIVNKNGNGISAAIRYIRNLDGTIIRVDSAQRSLIKTMQRVDSTHSFLCSGLGADLFLLDWFTGDTIQTFSSDTIAQLYNGALNPTNWEISFYHNDGLYIYLKVFEPTLVFSYGYEILKLNISNGKLENFKTFKEESSIFSSSQSFAMIVKDSIRDFGTNYISYHSIYNSLWQKTHSLSFLSEKFYGNETGSVPVYFSDSLVLFCSNVKDKRIPPDNQIKGSQLRIYDLVNNSWLGSAQFFAANTGSSFILGEIFGVKKGYIYLNTQHDVSNFNYSLLLCLPLDLNYDNSLFYRNLGEVDIKKNKTLEVYPNPVQKSIKIITDQSYDKIHFYSTNGKLIKTSSYTESSQYSTGSLAPGLYQLVLVSKNKAIAETKVIKVD
ncbi:T9SS type A sorting domain-containing protein [Croceimicrobium sp.]|uniref:T9SS type A sorting domain-containing protein n=1 Tax=Croceimicrobium sp. TaxID=2828340 RepID=UPI003BA8BB38